MSLLKNRNSISPGRYFFGRRPEHVVNITTIALTALTALTTR
jgi:hypothetical protein